MLQPLVKAFPEVTVLLSVGAVSPTNVALLQPTAPLPAPPPVARVPAGTAVLPAGGGVMTKLNGVPPASCVPNGEEPVARAKVASGVVVTALVGVTACAVCVMPAPIPAESVCAAAV